MPFANETIDMEFSEAVAWVKESFVGVLDDDYPDNEAFCWVTLVDGGMSESQADKVMARWNMIQCSPAV